MEDLVPTQLLQQRDQAGACLYDNTMALKTTQEFYALNLSIYVFDTGTVCSTANFINLFKKSMDFSIS